MNNSINPNTLGSEPQIMPTPNPVMAATAAPQMPTQPEAPVCDPTQVVEHPTAQPEQPVQAKKKRRGVSNETRGASRKKFQHTDVYPGTNLFLGNVAVSKTMLEVGEDAKGQFNGHSMPRLVIEFSSLHEADAKRYAYINVNPVESTIDTIQGGKDEWKFNQAMGAIKHLLDVFYLKGRPLTEQEEDMLSLAYDDTDEDGQYSPVDVETVLNSWSILFDNVVGLLNGSFDGKKHLTDIVWAKMIRYYRNKSKGWVATDNGDIAFSSFVESGWFELAVMDNNTKAYRQPNLFLDLTKQQIIPRPDVDNKPAAASAPALGGIGIAAGAGVIPMAGHVDSSIPAYGAGGYDGGSEGNMPF